MTGIFPTSQWAWYVGMHRLALLYADSARTNPSYWVKALHYEANALHSLTDSFAFGHVVTNSDEPSHSIIQTSGLENRPVYQWMEYALGLGGGKRNAKGMLELNAALPPLAGRASPRDVFQNTAPSLWENLTKLAEMFYHDTFNDGGATVRNLRGDEFTIFGDGPLARMLSSNRSAVDAAAGAVTASVQSLFDGYDALSKGSASVAQLSADPSFFAALRYLPVYVVHDPGKYFTGRWTRYAQFANLLTGGKPLEKFPDCSIQYLSGANLNNTVKRALDLDITRDMLPWPSPSNQACVAF